MKKNLSLCLALMAVGFLLRAQERENKLGGHFGFVHGFVTISDGDLTTIADLYSIGFPTGITIKTNDWTAFDVEFVPSINGHNNVNLLFHPGVLLNLGKNWTLGARAAYEIGKNSYGFTPLINKSFPLKKDVALFGEIVLPVRFGDATSLTLGLHLGVGF